MARLIIGENSSTLYCDNGQTIVHNNTSSNNEVCKYRIREKFRGNEWLCKTSCGYLHARLNLGMTQCPYCNRHIQIISRNGKIKRA